MLLHITFIYTLTELIRIDTIYFYIQTLAKIFYVCLMWTKMLMEALENHYSYFLFLYDKYGMEAKSIPLY